MRTLRIAPCLLLPLLLALAVARIPTRCCWNATCAAGSDLPVAGYARRRLQRARIHDSRKRGLKKELSEGSRARPALPCSRLPLICPPAPARSIKPPEMPKFEAPQIELPTTPETLPKETGPTNDEAAVDGSPTKIVFNKRLTGGLDRDGQPGDEGILVAVEPRDDAGRLIETAGAMSIVLLDPAEQGEQARVARWNYRADEIPGHFHNTPFGRGLQFELPWPGEPPKNRDLQLFVRFTTIEGQKITADTKIDVPAPPWPAPAAHPIPGPPRKTPAVRRRELACRHAPARRAGPRPAVRRCRETVRDAPPPPPTFGLPGPTIPWTKRPARIAQSGSPIADPPRHNACTIHSGPPALPRGPVNFGLAAATTSRGCTR